MSAFAAAGEWAARRKLRAIAALGGLYITTGLGWTWPWGVLFLLLTWPSVRSGAVELVDFVRRDENPVVFWAIVTTWLLMSASLVAMDVARWLWPEAYRAMVLA